jgi:hypothetical protein
MGSQPAGDDVAVPGLFVAANVAVCAPVVAELLTMIDEFPANVPPSWSAAVPSTPDLSVSVTPVPPLLGASRVPSPVVAILNPYGLSDEVPTVDSVE